jgi:hypothetical protein
MHELNLMKIENLTEFFLGIDPRGLLSPARLKSDFKFFAMTGSVRRCQTRCWASRVYRGT